MWHTLNAREYTNKALKGKSEFPSTFQFQDSLPPLPVPPLDQTLNKYLETVEPAVSPAQFESTKKLVEDFRNGIGRQLQKALEDHAAKKTQEGKSWLEDWWLMAAYHMWKDPLVITSNYYCTIPDHPLSTSTFIHQISRATTLTVGFLVYKSLVEQGLLPPDSVRQQPLCMDQVTRIFSTTRIPGENGDHLLITPKSRHIVVMRKDQFFSFDVLDQNGKILPEVDIQAQFKFVWEETEVFTEEPPIGVFTGEWRDVWAKQRNKLRENEINLKTLDLIETAIFVVSLDETSPDSWHEVVQRIFHNYNGRNRWFDKSINLVIFKNGRAGVNAEHSPLDAPPLVHGAVTFAFKYETPESYSHVFSNIDSPRSGGLPSPVKLHWKISEETKKNILTSASNVKNFISTFETEFFEYFSYGADFLKTVKLSPDAYFQMVIQLAYFKIHKKVVATYETAQTRKFLHGRTETVRTLSKASKAFVEGMENPKLSNKEKYQLLVNAISGHTKYMTDASNGQAIDRHLLGLLICAQGSGAPLPPFFTDPSFIESRRFVLSTSNLTPAPTFYGGYGPITFDGYGVCYALRPGNFGFSVSSRTTCHSTDTKMMSRALAASLDEMRNLCLSVQNSNL